PCSVGLSDNQRNTIFSWVRVSFRGRPLTGRASRPVKPFRSNLAYQRRTLLGSTSRNSATSWVEYPSRIRSTARTRRCSSSTGEPLFLIQTNIRLKEFCVHYFS